MRKNNWVFYFFILLFTAILSINLVWRFTPIRSEISLTLQDGLKPYLGKTFAVNDFSLGFGYMSFYNITAGSKDGNYILNLDEIQVGYSIHKLIYNKLDPLRVIESITFKNPRLILLTDKKDTIRSTEMEPVDIANIISGFQKLAEIDRVLIQNGQILWGKSNKELTKFVSKLDGYLVINSRMKANLNLRGELFESSQKDFSLKGNINFIDNNWEMWAQIEKSEIKKSLPFLNSENFSVEEAHLSGNLHLVSSTFNIRDVDVRGDIKVQNMYALLFGQQLNTQDYDIKFNGQEMILDSVKGSVEDGSFDLTGNLGTIFQPGLYLGIDFENYSAKDLVISAPILELLNQGKISGKINIEGPATDLTIRGNIYSDTLYYSIVPFHDAILNFIYKDKIWNFLNIKTTSIGLNHSGTGKIDFNSMKMALNIFSVRHIGTEAFKIITKLNNTEMSYFTVVEGDFPTQTFLGDIHAVFHHQIDSLLNMDAHFKLVKNRITVQSTKSFPEKLSLYADVTNLWDNPTFNILELKNFPFDSLSYNQGVKWLSQNFRNDFYFSGPVNFPTMKVNFSKKNSKEILFSFVGSAINLIEPNFRFRGRFTLQTRPDLISGEIAIEDKASELVLKLNSPDMAEGDLSMGYAENPSLSGKVKFNKIDLNHYLGRFPDLYKSIRQGDMFGEIVLSGTTNKPDIYFNLQAENFIINENGYYSANLKGAFRNQKLYFNNTAINYNNRPIMKIDFDWDVMKDDLKAKLLGEEIETNFIASTIFKDPEIIRGDLEYQLNFKGPLYRPDITGNIYMRSGFIKNHSFKNLNITFTDSIPPTATLFQLNKHILKIPQLLYSDEKGYTIETYGLLPVDQKGEMDIHMEVNGNVLAELPYIIDYFQNPECKGNMSLHLAGTRENPKLRAGEIKIFDGALEFESVIPPVNNLKANISLQEGNQFINIHLFEGDISEQHFKIYNTEKVLINNKELKPWYFEDIGLDLGILILETGQKGIPLSIPGLMNPGDIGYFAASGKTDSEKFYFSGPQEMPHVRGKITLTDSRVTFPFLEVEEDIQNTEENKVLDFLMSINWDLFTKAGVGNRYFVDIPAVIGQVYLDLNIDQVSEGLEFSGRLIDESFRTEGKVESTRGRVEYLDMNFRVDRFGAIFNRFELYPEVYGRAWTTVRDSSNFPRDIYLVLYTIDPETKQEVAGGRWEDFRFKLVSSDPTIGETQENVLAYLGYSVDNISNKASDVGLTLTENYLIRPLVRPLERKLERGLQLDYVRLRSHITSNLVNYGFHNQLKFLQEPNYSEQNLNYTIDPALLFLQSSEITLGKYLLGGVYLTYSGQLVSIYDESKLGVNHKFGIEYRLLRNLLLEFEYDKLQFNPQYYSRDALNDFRIRLRHSFSF